MRARIVPAVKAPEHYLSKAEEEKNGRRHGRSLDYPATVRTRIIGPCARTLDLPLLVRSGAFFFFLLFRGGQIFGVFFAPFLEEGNFRLHSTWSDYSSSYGSRFSCPRHLHQIQKVSLVFYDAIPRGGHDLVTGRGGEGIPQGSWVCYGHCSI